MTTRTLIGAKVVLLPHRSECELLSFAEVSMLFGFRDRRLWYAHAVHRIFPPPDVAFTFPNEPPKVYWSMSTLRGHYERELLRMQSETVD